MDLSHGMPLSMVAEEWCQWLSEEPDSSRLLNAESGSTFWPKRSVLGSPDMVRADLIWAVGADDEDVEDTEKPGMLWDLGPPHSSDVLPPALYTVASPW